MVLSPPLVITRQQIDELVTIATTSLDQTHDILADLGAT
jgi:adenosylmethionine-8-amino-7-oxononanoate aminotransferase